VTSCTSLLQTLARNLTTTANCGADLEAQNPTVLQAYAGLLAYPVLYSASCLRNPSTSAYCFADAVTNSSSPTDPYVYYLPLNVSLPGGSQPTCSTCLQQTMAIFETASANKSQGIYSTYTSAAGQINSQCGPGFVNATVAQVSTGAAGRIPRGPSMVGWGMLGLVVLGLVL
jgi:hypothetical protein